MPRTVQATIALIVTLNVVVILTILNLWQTHNAEKNVIELGQRVDQLNRTTAQIMSRLEQGVAVAGGGGQGQQRGGADRYAAALNDPANILKAPTDQLIYPGATPGGTLRRAMGSDPKGFNWLVENSVDVAEIQTYMHNSFARQDFDQPDNFVPELAYKITVNDDYTQYTIHLREGVYWQVPPVNFANPRYEWLREPRELTAEDAVFYFEMALNPQVEAGYIKSYVEDIDKVEVIDRYTFRVTWKRSVYNSITTTLGGYPLPKWLFTKDEDGNDIPAETLGLEFNTHWASEYPIGTGPYRFVRFNAGENLILERSDSYWGQAPPIERIEYHIIRDPEQQFAQLLNGQIDFMGAIPSPRYKSEVLDGGPNSPFKNGRLKHEVVDVFAYFYIGWNMDKPLFSDKRVRLAMTHALNRQGIIDSVFFGLGEIQTGPYYYKHPATDPAIEAYAFDLQKAAALLEEAGWVDTNGDGVRDKVINGERIDFRFTLTAYDQPDVRSYAAVYREDLRKIGIVMNPEFVQWPLMQRRMDEKNFDAFTGGWGLSWFNDPYQIWHSSQADIPKGSNRVGFRNKEADELIETLRVTFDTEERQKLLRRFHHIVHEEQPYTFFYVRQSVAAWNPRLQNVVFQQIRPQSYSLPWYIEGGK
jgi:peptide/nickel transport system substrate-binding protein